MNKYNNYYNSYNTNIQSTIEELKNKKKLTPDTISELALLQTNLNFDAKTERKLLNLRAHVLRARGKIAAYKNGEESKELDFQLTRLINLIDPYSVVYSLLQERLEKYISDSEGTWRPHAERLLEELAKFDENNPPYGTTAFYDLKLKAEESEYIKDPEYIYSINKMDKFKDFFKDCASNKLKQDGVKIGIIIHSTSSAHLLPELLDLIQKLPSRSYSIERKRQDKFSLKISYCQKVLLELRDALKSSLDATLIVLIKDAIALLENAMKGSGPECDLCEIKAKLQEKFGPRLKGGWLYGPCSVSEKIIKLIYDVPDTEIEAIFESCPSSFGAAQEAKSRTSEEVEQEFIELLRKQENLIKEISEWNLQTNNRNAPSILQEFMKISQLIRKNLSSLKFYFPNTTPLPVGNFSTSTNVNEKQELSLKPLEISGFDFISKSSMEVVFSPEAKGSPRKGEVKKEETAASEQPTPMEVILPIEKQFEGVALKM